MKLQKHLEQIIIQTYFSLGKALPVQLRWPHLLRIYKQASQSYQPEQLPEGIEKAIIIHVNDREIEDWVNLFNHTSETYGIDCSHLQLIEAPHIFNWLNILKKTINESLCK